MAALSLCMIVRDESEVLARCLESIAGVADDLVIVDTGSVDDTVAIAHAYGARVEYFKWIDDFAAARNHSFDLAVCSYILWLDADDLLLPEQREKLIDLKQRLDRDVYWLRYDYSQDLFGSSTCLLYRERIVRNTPEIRWRYPAHEVLAIPPQATAETVEITISHRRTPAGIARDRGRTLRILERALARHGQAASPRLRFDLAREYQGAGLLAAAVCAYEEFLALEEAWVEDRVGAWEALAECHLAMAAQDPPQAAEHFGRGRLAAAEARRLDPRRAEPCFLLGRIAEEEGDLEAAVPWYERAFRPLPETLGQVSPYTYGVGPAVRLCEIWKKRGDLAKANDYNELALRWSPNDPLLLLTRRELRLRAQERAAARSPSRSRTRRAGGRTGWRCP